MASIFRDPKRSKFWIACYKGIHGERIQAPTKLEDEDAAKVFARNLERGVEMARNGKLSAEIARRLLNDILLAAGEEQLPETTIEDWCRGWMSDIKTSNAEGTVARYGQVIEEFIKFMGKKAKSSLRHLSLEDIRKFREKLLKEGLSPRSANLAIKTLGACLNLAVNQGYRTHNPAKGMKPVVGKSIAKKGFTLPQIQLILISCPSQEWRNLVKTAYYTGGRLGDVVRFLIQQCDRTNNTIIYTPSKQRRTKEPESITLPLHPELIVMLDEIGRTSGPLFPTLSRKSVGGKTGLSLSFRAIIDAAKIPYETWKPRGKRGRKVYSLGFHSLRRSFNSLLANRGVTQEIRQKLIGHASEEVNDKYTVLQTETLRQAVHLLPTVSEPTTSPAGEKKSP